MAKNSSSNDVLAPSDRVQDQDDAELDEIAAIPTLPRVATIEVRASPTRVEVKEEPEPKKANIHFELKPFSPTPRKAMVTMSDLGGLGRPRGDVQPARSKRKD